MNTKTPYQLPFIELYTTIYFLRLDSKYIVYYGQNHSCLYIPIYLSIFLFIYIPILWLTSITFTIIEILHTHSRNTNEKRDLITHKKIKFFSTMKTLIPFPIIFIREQNLTLSVL